MKHAPNGTATLYASSASVLTFAIGSSYNTTTFLVGTEFNLQLEIVVYPDFEFLHLDILVSFCRNADRVFAGFEPEFDHPDAVPCQLRFGSPSLDALCGKQFSHEFRRILACHAEDASLFPP